MFQDGAPRSAKRTPSSSKRGQEKPSLGSGSLEMAMGLDRIRAARASVALPSPAASQTSRAELPDLGRAAGKSRSSVDTVRETALANAILARYDAKVEIKGTEDSEALWTSP